MDDFLNAPLYVIDDMRLNLAMLDTMLKRHGFSNIHTFNKPLEGLRCAIQTPPALMLVDIIMPEMDGYTLCQQARH